MKLKTRKRVFVIDRAKWRCGGYGRRRHGTGFTRLLGSDGMMCCLGHVSCQIGLTTRQIRLKAEPYQVSSLTRINTILTCNSQNSDFTADAMNINDNENLTDSQRERKLIALGKKHGLTIRFKGKFVDGKDGKP